MKKSNYVWGLLMALLFCYAYYRIRSKEKVMHTSNRILEVKNCGNLNCVLFVQEGDTFALDFLTDRELDSLKFKLYEFEQRKSNAGSL